MDLASNTKTLIFDDNYDEIAYLRQALDQLKIQSLHVNFNEISNISEETKFTNVRFVFADIIRGTARTSQKADIAPIVTAITEHISKKNGAFILIIWSKHCNDLSDLLIEDLKSENYNFFPIIDINKEKYIVKVTSESKKRQLINNLKKELQSKLKNKTEYFDLLRIWERDIHTATSETFNLFLDDLTDKTKTHSLLKNAMIASSGSNQRTDDISKRKSLWNTLNMVLNDNVESSLHSLSIAPKISKTLQKLDKKNKETTLSLVNKKILFTQTNNSDTKMYPGNIFCFQQYASCCNDIKDKICGYKNAESLISEILDDEKFGTYIKKYKNDHSLSNGDTSKFRKEQKSTFIPILLEFTPYCDYSQKSYKKARLIFGHIIPTSFKKYIKSSTKYIYTTPNFFLDQNIEHIKIGEYFIVLNIKHIFGINPNILDNFLLLFRARKELVNDIQHDIANHISRIGVTSL